MVMAARSSSIISVSSGAKKKQRLASTRHHLAWLSLTGGCICVISYCFAAVSVLSFQVNNCRLVNTSASFGRRRQRKKERK